MCGNIVIRYRPQPLLNIRKLQVVIVKKVRILGVDPGYAIVGFGVLDYDGLRFTPVEYGAVLTEAGTPFPERLKAIHHDMEFIFEKYKPDCMAIEKLYFNTNHTTGVRVHALAGEICRGWLRKSREKTGHGDDAPAPRARADTQARRRCGRARYRYLSRSLHPLGLTFGGDSR